MAELLNDTTFICAIMGIVAFLITQGLKWAFVKPFTKNLPKRKKTLINCSILLIAFGAVVLCEFLYSHFWLKAPISFDRAFFGWGGASGVYGIFEMIVKFIKGDDATVENPFKTQEGIATVEFVQNVIKDGEVNKKDISVLSDFSDKLDKVK